MSTYRKSTSILHLTSLFLAFAFGVIGGSVGLNALIKSNQEKSSLRSNLPAGTQVTVNTDDVYHTGVVVTTVCAIIAVLTAIFMFLHIIPRSALASRTTPVLQSGLLAFCALWLFAALVPFTLYFAQHEAKVTASLGGIELPQAVILQVEKLLGVTSVYRDIAYLRLVAILPWFTVLFTSIAAAIAASRPTPHHQATTGTQP